MRHGQCASASSFLVLQRVRHRDGRRGWGVKTRSAGADQSTLARNFCARGLRPLGPKVNKSRLGMTEELIANERDLSRFAAAYGLWRLSASWPDEPSQAGRMRP